MFKFLFSKSGDVPKIETQRERIERALSEVNEITAMMDPRPRVTIDPETGEISLELPEQMPDEALALPSPEEPTSEDQQVSGEKKAA